jgi:Tol biopolymer transport system component
MELLNANNGMAPAWSPDGRWIAFLSNREAGWDIFRMAADGSDQVRLTSGRAPEAPAWTADGEWILFERDRRIEVVGVDGTESRTVIEEAGWGSAPACRPGTEQFAFVHEGDIHLGDLGGNILSRITASGGDASPSWSPDGGSVALSRSGAIWVVDVGSGQERRLTEGSEDEEPAWSPDGERIVFVRAASLWITDAASGPPQPLPGMPEPAGSPTWSPDGEGLALHAYQAGNWEIVVARADGGGARSLTEATWISSRAD